MKSLPVVVVIAFAIFEAHDLLQKVEGKERSCQSVIQDLTKLQLSGISTCTKKMKFKNGKEKSKKMNCILRCVMINVGLLGDDGQVIQGEALEGFIAKMFPESLAERANRTFTPCLDIGIKTPFQTPEEDPYCNTLDPFIKCLFTQLPNFCS